MRNTILYKEIHEQPYVISHLVEKEFKSIQKIANQIKNKFHYVLIAARGTSDNAARYAQYLFGVENQYQVALATPSLFSLYNKRPDLKGALVIGISQSGQSPDIVSVIEEGHRQNCPTLAITNDSNSPLAKASEYVFPLHAGAEKSVAATKTYTASLAVLSLLSTALNNDNRRLRELIDLPNLMEKAFAGFEKQIEKADRYRYIDRCIVLGRGFNYSTTFEIALKIKELTGIVTESYSTADFKHGPIATIYKGFPVILIAPKGCMLADLTKMQQSLCEKKAEIIAISNDKTILSNAQFPLSIPAKVPEWISPILAVIPGQLLALKLAYEMGLDPDHPLGLTKVTQTL
jgi:glucosamine--fructose-6-phosphate aminotransferase (isomerizing)